MTLNLRQQQAFNEVMEGSNRVILIQGSAGTGKALINTELVLTPEGFKQIQDLTLFDKVYGVDGQTYSILGIFPQGKKECYRVKFKDDTSCDCCKDHLWEVYRINNPKGRPKVKTVAKILSEPYKGKKYDKRYDSYQNNYRYGIPFTKPIRFFKKDLKIHPYVLGVLLGDGCLVGNNIKLSVTERIDLEFFKRNLPKGVTLSKFIANKGPKCYDIGIIGEQKGKNPLIDSLRFYGLQGKKSIEKHIPTDYLMSSVEDRLLLYRGLTETDGYFNPTTGKIIEYSTSSEQLAKDFLFLARSLGKYVSCKDRLPKCNGEIKHKSWRIRELTAKSKAVVDIEPISLEECTCIFTDAPRGLFITRDFNVTHNTHLTTEIIKKYPGTVLVTATTNKAKNNLQEATGVEALTTHSALGYIMSKNEYDLKLSKVRESKEADLLVIDEVSMLEERVYQSALQGSYKKILLVGDELQLPSVNTQANIKPDITITLTEQMRQAEDDHKLKEFFYKVRTAIKAGKRGNLMDEAPENIMIYKYFGEFVQAYRKCKNNKRILAYTNQVVDRYNAAISKTKGFMYNLGDILVLDKPLGSAKNGDYVTVTEAEVGDLGWKLTVVTELGHSYKILVPKSKEVENKLLTKAANDGQAEYWRVKESIFRPKHIFASTIHKAQGMTIDEVFIDVTDLNAQTKVKPTRFNAYKKPMDFDTFYRLLYVAMSRMKVKAHLFIGQERTYKYFNRKVKDE